MLIQNLEKKIRTVTIIATTAVTASALVVIITIFLCMRAIDREQNQVYVLSNDIPLFAERTSQKEDLIIEAKSHIEMFHQYFFSLSPDDEYIDYTLRKALYLIDESGVKQKKTLQEKGFYNNIKTASAVMTIMTDSIRFSPDSMSFTYFGKQHIERPSSYVIRLLTTKGNVKKVPRSGNNPHGLLITNWRTVENKDIDYKQKTY